MGLPKTWIYAAIPIGGALMILYSLAPLWQALRGLYPMITITIAAFVILLILAVPVAFAVGMAGFLGLWWSGAYPLAIIIQQIFLTADSFVLLAIPLFVLAGALMETGGIAVRLVRFAQALVGWIRGGLAMAVVVAEYIFSGISGSTIADVSAIGATMIPSLTRAGYKPEEAVSVVAAASAMGILVPPCILMIIIGAIANVSVAALFAGGFIPALVLPSPSWSTSTWGHGGEAWCRPSGPASGRLGRAFVDALIPMGLPIIIFGGILGGVFTPTEAAAVAVLYAAIVGLFVYKEIAWSAIPEILLAERRDYGECLLSARDGSRGGVDLGGGTGSGVSGGDAADRCPPGRRPS